MAITTSASESGQRTRRSAVDTAAIYVDERTLFARTGISRSKWQQMRYAKEGPPFYKLPGNARRVLYKWSEVVSWLESAKTQP